MIPFHLRSGKIIDLEDPHPNHILLGDITHALSNIARFAGHARSFYSVAQHSVFLSWIVPPEHRLQALLHDASEAYLQDLSGPLKHSCYLADYRKLEDKMQHRIFMKFGIEPVSLVRDFDHMLSYDELDQLVLGRPSSLGRTRHDFLRPIIEWTCTEAEDAFGQALEEQLP